MDSLDMWQSTRQIFIKSKILLTYFKMKKTCLEISTENITFH